MILFLILVGCVSERKLASSEIIYEETASNFTYDIAFNNLELLLGCPKDLEKNEIRTCPNSFVNLINSTETKIQIDFINPFIYNNLKSTLTQEINFLETKFKKYPFNFNNFNISEEYRELEKILITMNSSTGNSSEKNNIRANLMKLRRRYTHQTPEQLIIYLSLPSSIKKPTNLDCWVILENGYKIDFDNNENKEILRYEFKITENKLSPAKDCLKDIINQDLSNTSYKIQTIEFRDFKDPFEFKRLPFSVTK